MRTTLWLSGALAALALVAGCGGDGDAGAGTAAEPASDDAAAAVLAAYEQLRGSSYRATVLQTIGFDTGDAPPEQLARALESATGSTTSEVEAESGGSRVQGVVDSPQFPLDLTVVLYDGETFVSAGDSGAKRLAGSLGGLFADLADIGSEELGQALENVTDEGPATVDGRRMRRYSATLSREFTDELTDQVLRGFGVDASQVDVSFRPSDMTIDLLPDGTLARQLSSMVTKIDLTRVAGSGAVVTQTTGAEQTIRDVGAPITVARPEATGEITEPVEFAALLS
jgi:hypothetical protein